LSDRLPSRLPAENIRRIVTLRTSSSLLGLLEGDCAKIASVYLLATAMTVSGTFSVNSNNFTSREIAHKYTILFRYTISVDMGGISDSQMHSLLFDYLSFRSPRRGACITVPGFASQRTHSSWLVGYTLFSVHLIDQLKEEFKGLDPSQRNEWIEKQLTFVRMRKKVSGSVYA
jgi:hypothetical protein